MARELRTLAFLFVLVLAGSPWTYQLPAQAPDVNPQIHSDNEAGADPALLAALLERHQPRRRSFEFALIGDTQYNDQQEAEFLNVMRVLDGKRLSFIVHDGDFKSGAARMSFSMTGCRRSMAPGTRSSLHRATTIGPIAGP